MLILVSIPFYLVEYIMDQIKKIDPKGNWH